jgi:hypothetical protein
MSNDNRHKSQKIEASGIRRPWSRLVFDKVRAIAEFW